MAGRCCLCNGPKAICMSCSCVKNGSKCTSCRPKENNACCNIIQTSPLSPQHSSSRDCPSPSQSSNSATAVSGNQSVHKSYTSQVKEKTEVTYEPSDLVWAKMRGYPQWPGRVVYNPPGQTKPSSNHYYIFFYGTHDVAWMSNKDLLPFKKYQEKLRRSSQRQRPGLNEALWEVEEDPDLLLSEHHLALKQLLKGIGKKKNSRNQAKERKKPLDSQEGNTTPVTTSLESQTDTSNRRRSARLKSNTCTPSQPLLSPAATPILISPSSSNIPTVYTITLSDTNSSVPSISSEKPSQKSFARKSKMSPSNAPQVHSYSTRRNKSAQAEKDARTEYTKKGNSPCTDKEEPITLEPMKILDETMDTQTTVNISTTKIVENMDTCLALENSKKTIETLGETMEITCEAMETFDGVSDTTTSVAIEVMKETSDGTMETTEEAIPTTRDVIETKVEMAGEAIETTVEEMETTKEETTTTGDAVEITSEAKETTEEAIVEPIDEPIRRTTRYDIETSGEEIKMAFELIATAIVETTEEMASQAIDTISRETETASETVLNSTSETIVLTTMKTDVCEVIEEATRQRHIPPVKTIAPANSEAMEMDIELITEPIIEELIETTVNTIEGTRESSENIQGPTIETVKELNISSTVEGKVVETLVNDAVEETLVNDAVEETLVNDAVEEIVVITNDITSDTMVFNGPVEEKSKETINEQVEEAMEKETEPIIIQVHNSINTPSKAIIQDTITTCTSAQETTGKEKSDAHVQSKPALTDNDQPKELSEAVSGPTELVPPPCTNEELTVPDINGDDYSPVDSSSSSTVVTDATATKPQLKLKAPSQKQISQSMSKVDALNVYNYNLKVSLIVDHTEPQKALKSLRGLLELQFSASDVTEVKDLVYTLRKVRMFKGNSRVRNRANEVYNKIKGLYINENRQKIPPSTNENSCLDENGQPKKRKVVDDVDLQTKYSKTETEDKTDETPACRRSRRSALRGRVNYTELSSGQGGHTSEEEEQTVPELG